MTKRLSGRGLVLLLCAIAALGLFAAAALADGAVPYVERSWNGTQVVSTDQTHTAEPVPSNGNMTSGWYYLNSNVTKNGRVESITGDVCLILGDGYTLDVKGLYVPQGSTLTIYAQSDGENAGKIYSHPSGGAAIGGYSGHDNGNIVIHGGTIETTGYDHCAGIGSNDGKTGGAITIYGGEITATGGSDGAGIGGGRNCSGGTITIYGGDITAHGGSENGAGIGGGDSGDGGTIVIWGGTITANEDPNENGAGIGGGDCGNGGTITIHGGTLTLYSRDGAGIGGGDDGDGGTITIHGGTITSTKVNQGQGARIGGGCDGAPGTIIVSGGTVTTIGGSGAGIGGGKGNKSGGSVTIDGGIISASGSYGIGSGEEGADVAITLGWTDATSETISITASSYGGTVTAAQPFKTDTTLIYPGTVTDVSPLAGSTLLAWDGKITSWGMLQLAVNSAQDGAVITLQQSLTANSSDTAIVVPGGKTVTLDLNGFTLDRAMTDAAADGYVIRNNGTLIIIDSGDSEAAGTIRGGWNTGDGGGIYNTGTLNLQGGLIETNKSGGNGGGIYNAGTVNMTGGTIRLNSADTGGGGVHVSESANLVVSGSPTVENNTKGELANNINLAGNAVIQVDGALAEGARLGVFISGAFGVFTDGYGANNTASPDSFFFADTGGWCVFLEEGEGSLSSTWEQFRLSLNQGGSIALTEDITAFPYDSILSIPAGVTVELDLQGHTLDASALNPPAGVEYPCCLSINGILTLSDTVGGGRFKGGDNGFIDFIAAESGSSFTMNGGAIVGSGTLENVVYVYDYATFTMCGGAVTADMNGTVRRFGRVSVDDYATFIMNGGTIGGSGGQSDIYADGGCVRLNGGSLTGSNPAYGNVYVLSADQIKNGELFVSGSPHMSTGVYLDYDHTITVAGPLGEGVIIPVITKAKPTNAEPVIITNGLAQGGENAVSHFTSASDIWCVVLNDDGEAELRKAPTEWDTLQLLIDGTENGGVLTLEKDYTATNKDRYLNIAGGKALTIDLNGHTIDGSALNDDYVMTISGNLTLRDSTGGGTVLGRNHQDVIKTLSDNAVLCLESGTIHGDNCYDVVYVYAGGSFIMTGGTVSGSGSSGHIDVLVECGTFTLTGGSIRADQKGSDTAVLTTKYTNFNLQGSPDIKGSFELGKPVQFTGPISHDLRIKVRRTGDLHNEWNDVFTSGLPGNGTVNNFISYYPKNYAVGLNEAGEAFLGSPVTVVFAPGYETNETMETVSWAKDGWYPLPACGFSGPAGHAFAGWRVWEDAETVNAGDLINVSDGITLTAVWQVGAFGNPDFEIPTGTRTIGDNAFEGIAATVVEIPEDCTHIGNEAFRYCTQLTMIRIPAGCQLGERVFDGCTKVYVFGAAGSDAQRYCNENANCVFVEDAQE